MEGRGAAFVEGRDTFGEVLGVATSTVKLDWQKAKAWLYRELAEA